MLSKKLNLLTLYVCKTKKNKLRLIIKKELAFQRGLANTRIGIQSRISKNLQSVSNRTKKL